MHLMPRNIKFFVYKTGKAATSDKVKGCIGLDELSRISDDNSTGDRLTTVRYSDF